MNYSKIIYYDTGNARGLSTVLFVSGCENYCAGCHNRETWDFSYGKPYTDEVEEDIIKSLKNNHIKNLVLSGGDPLHYKNIETVLNLAKRVRKEANVKIILYSGYTLDTIKVFPMYNILRKYVNILIDGKFDKNNVSPILDYRGSLNQQAYELSPEKEPINISKEYFKYNKSSYDY